MKDKKKGKCHILKTACLNTSSLTTTTKQDAIRKWLKHEDIDVLGISETCFREGSEPKGWLDDYRLFFNSVSLTTFDTLTDHGRHAYKWGVLLIVKSSIKICDVIRPQGNLNGRVVMMGIYMEAKEPKMLWIVCVYAPVRMHEHEVFFNELDTAWKGCVKEKDQVILLGDLNAHLMGSALERSAPSEAYDKDSSIFRKFVLAHGLLDARALLGVMEVSRDFTYTHYDGSLARLDYHLTTSLESVLTFQTVDFNRIATSHRAIVVESDLYRLTGGWKTKMRPVSYPTPINVTNSTPEQCARFTEMETRWVSKLNRKMYVALVNNDSATDNYVLARQNTFIEDLTRLCVGKARKVWNDGQYFKHKRSKGKGILEAKITWLRRAYKGAIELNNYLGTKGGHRRATSLQKRLSASKWFPKLRVRVWRSLTERNKQVWLSKVKELLAAHLKVMKEKELEEKQAAKDKLRMFWLNDGVANSGRFRRWKLRMTSDPDGEVVKDKSGNILVGEKEVRDRYGEYYAELFSGANQRTSPPDINARNIWMDPTTISRNKEKLEKATKGISIAAAAPSLEEYLNIIKKGGPTSSGGHDQIQYGVLSKLSTGTHLAIVGMIGSWWRTKSLPAVLRLVEICSLHKRGDRMDLVNKRGIGLVCKLVLIMETVLLNRISAALENAGTRSLAQGGAKKGVHTSDVIATLVNVIHNAKRNNRPLHLVEFDLFKFFDSIPHEGFVDAHKYFGFDDDTIKLASLYWENFVGKARSRFGLSEAFPIKIGNIQGLAGSPSRSGLFLDMMLCSLERDNFGYRFTTDNHYTVREHPLDYYTTNVYAVAWVDDITLVEQDYDRLIRAVERYNTFINYYGMKFVPGKCKCYSINDEVVIRTPLSFTDLEGINHEIKKVNANEAFRSLGVFLNMNAEWHAHTDHVMGKLDSFAIKVGKHWSPAWLTAKVVNSNAIPAITYGLSLVNLQDREIAKIQTALIEPVKKDGSHSKFAPKKAYSMPIEQGGYNVASISAIYKATKIGGVYHFLNSTYFFAQITTRMTLWDLARTQGSLISPLDGKSYLNRKVTKVGFPDYMVAAAETLVTIGAAIIPRESIGLDEMSIATFARCIAKTDSRSAIFDILYLKGIKYMHQISTWFRPTILCADLGHTHISTVTWICVLRGLNRAFQIPTEEPLDIKEALTGINKARRYLLSTMIVQGIVNIVATDHALVFVPSSYKLAKQWKFMRLSSLGNPTEEEGTWYTDGSRIGESASFAVVTSEDNLVVKANIGGRSTSQRAELKGLEAAMFLGPNTNKVLDPKFIIKTVTSARREEIAEYQWSKVDNRSIIRSIVYLAKDSACTLRWVKGHQKGDITIDGKHNICADEHARSLTENPGPSRLDEAWEHADPYFFMIHNNLFEGDVRRAVYDHIIKEEIEAMKEGNERFRHDNWWMDTPTSTELTNYGILRFKIFTKTLPTHDRLNKSFPGLYGDVKCPGCGDQQESDVHIFRFCVGYNRYRRRAWRKVCSVLSEYTELDLSVVKEDVENWIKPKIVKEAEGAGLWFLGGAPLKVKVWLSNYVRKRMLKTIWQKIHKVIMETVKEIWDKRCERNCKKGWTFQNLHLGFIEDAIILENNLLIADNTDILKLGTL